VTVVGELGVLLDVSAGAGESVEDGVDVSTWLHRDDSELILLIDPDQESLGIIMENTSSLRPVSIKVACLKESISFFEKEMVIN